MWIVEEVPAWSPSKNHLRRLAAAPVHQLADPALAARLLGIGADAIVSGGDAGWGHIPRHGTLLGALFESLVTQSVRVYAQANEARVAHMHTLGGRQEIDLIVQRSDGSVVALEVKLSATIGAHDVRHLHWLAEKIGTDLLDACSYYNRPGCVSPKGRNRSHPRVAPDSLRRQTMRVRSRSQGVRSWDCRASVRIPNPAAPEDPTTPSPTR